MNYVIVNAVLTKYSVKDKRGNELVVIFTISSAIVEHVYAVVGVNMHALLQYSQHLQLMRF